MVSAPKDLERYWRLSFQEQERELIKGHHFKSLKPTIKMLKQLRDKQNHVQIASYYIKTIFLWEAKNQSENFWKMPWSYVTIMMLKKYANMIQAKSIPYYWNEHYNLISHLKDITITGIGNTLKNIVADVEKNSEDPFVFCKYLISTEEVDILRIEVDLGKKHIRKLKIMECLDISTSSSTTDSVISASQMSDDERIRRLILDDDFLREVAEHMSKYLKNYRSEQPSNSCSKDGLNDQSRTVKPHCQSNVPDLNTVSVLVGTCNMLNQRVSLLENGFRKLLVENDRLRDEINKMTASNVD
ncbi:hypothetical protein NQ317_019363 [Molorchus minor]|uniref:Mab-21-like HhH/H2TH-like domain-containing protein n=1 Tax=Molorchus minor TaxID=1323400 RepID=A0ABQ9JAD6_9CUCU|nr:hypothetical protein NQ317_019363 [Molorchus minor]